jgi:hypothetical protein
MSIYKPNSGRDATGPAEKKKAVPKAITGTNPQNPAREVERVTALRGQELPAPRMTEKVRRKLADRLFLKDSDLPYAELEESLRKMFLAIVERQDRLAEGLLLKLNATEYRLDDLEHNRDPDNDGGP